MDTAASGALAVELRPHSATEWIALYYPMVATTAGRWAEVTWVLHQCLVPGTPDPMEPARWLEARSPDSGHPCYAGHNAGATELADGYAVARAVYDAEEPLLRQDAQQFSTGTVVVSAGQLSEWVLDDLEDDASHVHG